MPAVLTAHQRISPKCLALAILPFVLMPLSGCYERVVGARGLGATGVRVQEPYVKDRWGEPSGDLKQMKVKPTKRNSKPW
jgi:hypothetical protein